MLPRSINTDQDIAQGGVCLDALPSGWGAPQLERVLPRGRHRDRAGGAGPDGRDRQPAARAGGEQSDHDRGRAGYREPRRDSGNATIFERLSVVQAETRPGRGGQNPGGGGGAGGSFMTRAGNGGGGDNGLNQSGQAADADASPPAILRNGCAGQPGGGSPMNDAGGGGGASIWSRGASSTSPGRSMRRGRVAREPTTRTAGAVVAPAA